MSGYVLTPLAKADIFDIWASPAAAKPITVANTRRSPPSPNSKISKSEPIQADGRGYCLSVIALAAF
jgi:hypothetical protein